MHQLREETKNEAKQRLRLAERKRDLEEAKAILAKKKDIEEARIARNVGNLIQDMEDERSLKRNVKHEKSITATKRQKKDDS